MRRLAGAGWCCWPGCRLSRRGIGWRCGVSCAGRVRCRWGRRPGRCRTCRRSVRWWTVWLVWWRLRPGPCWCLLRAVMGNGTPPGWISSTPRPGESEWSEFHADCGKYLAELEQGGANRQVHAGGAGGGGAESGQAPPMVPRAPQPGPAQFAGHRRLHHGFEALRGAVRELRRACLCRPEQPSCLAQAGRIHRVARRGGGSDVQAARLVGSCL